jgi:hypothetical protein
MERSASIRGNGRWEEAVSAPEDGIQGENGAEAAK